MRKQANRSGFSLVEVVLAIGIVATVIVAMMALIASLSTREREVNERRDAERAAAGLEAYLNSEVPFATAYSWLSAGPKELLSYTYRVNAEGDADPSGSAVRSAWYDPATIPPVPESDWVGRLIRAQIDLDPKLNPTPPPLPAAAVFSDAYVVVRASIFNVSSAAAAIPTNARPALTIPTVVHRR